MKVVKVIEREGWLWWKYGGWSRREGYIVTAEEGGLEGVEGGQ